MCVEEEIDQRADQCRTIRAIGGEGGARHLCTALQIKDAEPLRHRIVLWRWRRCRCAPIRRDPRMPLRRPGTNAAIRLRTANWNVFVGRVRYSKERIF